MFNNGVESFFNRGIIYTEKEVGFLKSQFFQSITIRIKFYIAL